mgnify:CR=1 FL=1
MHIKRFHARTMSEALRKVKAEFGPDAVILSVRHPRSGGLRGWFRPSEVEITAAAEPAPTEGASPPISPAPRVGGAPSPLSSASGRRGGSERGSVSTRRQERSEKREAGAAEPVTSGFRAVSDLHRQLAAHEVDDGLAWDLVSAVARVLSAEQMASGDMAEGLGRVLQERGVRLGPVAPRSPGNGAAIALVGPTGVGKTTTAAKLAARRLRRGHRPALVTLDQERIGGVEQLRIFARAMGLPFAAVARPGDLPDAVERLGTPELILDTPGTAPGDAEGIARLGDVMGRVPGLTATLVVSAAARDRDLDFALERFGAVSVRQIIVTKLDEAVVQGALLRLALRRWAPIAYFSDGPRVPEDLRTADIPGLVGRICGAAPPRRRADPRAEPASVAPGGGFVANRNSDRFHRRDCPAVRQIRPENQRVFGSAEEALACRYRPCKRCGADAAVENIAPSPPFSAAI